MLIPYIDFTHYFRSRSLLFMLSNFLKFRHANGGTEEVDEMLGRRRFITIDEAKKSYHAGT